MEKGFVENGFIIDLSDAKNTTQLVFELSSIMEHPDVKRKNVCLKLGSLDLKQSQLLSIKALIESMDASIAFIDTNSEQTEASAVSLGIIVSEISDSSVPSVGCTASEEIKEEAVVVKTEDEVLSGCINKDGLLKIRVTKEFGESTVSKILDLVENASSKKSKSENFITKFAKYYTPTVVIIAVLLAFIPPIILKDFNAFSVWLYRALSFLVVSCPCALVISIPLSFFGGIGGASKMGILIKGSNYLEALANTETVVFDKTGTLTEGIFEVQDIYAEGIEKDELLRIVAHAENYSNHPIAKSVKKAYNKEIDENIIKNPQELSGKGIWARIDEKDILVGNEKLMLEEKIDFKKCDEVGTILYVAIDKKYVGYVLIADKIKQDSSKTIRELKAMNIKETVMLTGDKKEVGEYASAGKDKLWL